MAIEYLHHLIDIKCFCQHGPSWQEEKPNDDDAPDDDDATVPGIIQ